MDYEYLFLGVSFSSSIFSALFCLALLGLKLVEDQTELMVKKATIVLILFYIVCIFFYTTTFFDIFQVLYFPCLKGVNFLTTLLIPTLFYHLIFRLTRLKKEEKFRYFHYGISLMLSFTFYLYHQTGLEIIVEGHYAKKSMLSFLLLNEDSVMATVFNLSYLLLSLYRLLIYRKNIANYSSDEERDSLVWLYPIFVIGFLLFPGSIVLYLFPQIQSNLIIGQLIPNFLFMFFNINLCYNLFCENFAQVTEDILEEEQLVNQETDKKVKELTIDKQKFEKYIVEKKPYLNPQLKITDLLSDLITNRSYLSQFINTTYKMNFCQYINHCRYNEYLKLKENSNLEQNAEEDLILISGFRSYESFKRTEDAVYRTKNKPQNTVTQ
ncbi:hypothetical protein HX004_14850 [Myroides sp. 1354]|uniref:hypothetical protein n=1 Tax=unclassified Myroides TaxID=2642485 RepID=UPI002577ADF8|nr:MULTISPECIES: hypothetical protein [unclassified Myroides]MDM1046135.1 hypothetical protein [Myroides sp. R163-1]MDM1057042.1 hypothetical protein [Myroides sp. 1354]MDM1070266.1 hypothetical protein [Myroides sp. 1372]